MPCLPLLELFDCSATLPLQEKWPIFTPNKLKMDFVWNLPRFGVLFDLVFGDFNLGVDRGEDSCSVSVKR